MTRQSAITRDPTPTNGQPYYCKLCGLGFGEFLACDMGDCQLESKQEAEARMTKKKRVAHAD